MRGSSCASRSALGLAIQAHLLRLEGVELTVTVTVALALTLTLTLTPTVTLTSSGLRVSSASERTNERCTPSARCSPAHRMQSAVAYVTEHHRSSAHLVRVTVGVRVKVRVGVRVLSARRVAVEARVVAGHAQEVCGGWRPHAARWGPLLL